MLASRLAALLDKMLAVVSDSPSVDLSEKAWEHQSDSLLVCASDFL